MAAVGPPACCAAAKRRRGPRPWRRHVIELPPAACRVQPGRPPRHARAGLGHGHSTPDRRRRASRRQLGGGGGLSAACQRRRRPWPTTWRRPACADRRGWTRRWQRRRLRRPDVGRREELRMKAGGLPIARPPLATDSARSARTGRPWLAEQGQPERPVQAWRDGFGSGRRSF